jgi:hypothetical protein
MKCSLAKTLADKHRSRVRKVIRKYQTVVATPYGPRQVLEGLQPRGAEKKPLVARFGGLARRRQPHAVSNDRPPQVYNNLHSELVQRLLADQGELCGSAVHCEVHPLRKRAALHRPGQTERPVWMQRMAALPQDPGRLPEVSRGDSSGTPLAAQANGTDHWKADLRSKDSRAVWRGAVGKVPTQVPRWQPTLRHAGFGEGPLEKCLSG